MLQLAQPLLHAHMQINWCSHSVSWSSPLHLSPQHPCHIIIWIIVSAVPPQVCSVPLFHIKKQTPHQQRTSQQLVFWALSRKHTFWRKSSYLGQSRVFPVHSKCVALITEYDCPCLFSGQALNVVKTLLQVRLHGLWILWLSQDLQNVIIGQEIEPREDLPFGLQVCVQGFKDFLQLKTHLWQLLWQTCKAQRRS